MDSFENKLVWALVVVVATGMAGSFFLGRATSPKPLDFGCLTVLPAADGGGVTVACPGTSDTILETNDSILIRCDCNADD